MGLQLLKKQVERDWESLKKDSWKNVVGQVCVVVATLWTIASAVFIPLYERQPENTRWLFVFLPIFVGVIIGIWTRVHGPFRMVPFKLEELINETTVRVFISCTSDDRAYRGKLEQCLHNIQDYYQNEWSMTYMSSSSLWYARYVKEERKKADLFIALVSRNYLDLSSRTEIEFCSIMAQIVNPEHKEGKQYLYPVLIEDEELIVKLRAKGFHADKMLPSKDVMPEEFSQYTVVPKSVDSREESVASDWKLVSANILHLIKRVEEEKKGPLLKWFRTLYGISADVLGKPPLVHKSSITTASVNSSSHFGTVNDQTGHDSDNQSGNIPTEVHLPTQNHHALKFFHRIIDVWNDEDLEDGQLIEIWGTVSLYAPLVIGSPNNKRKMHLAFRNDERPYPKETLDSALALTSGQMVCSIEIDKGKHFIGLYQSIVRNSLPLIVHEGCYEKNVQKFLEGNDKVFEARVIGRVRKSPAALGHLHWIEKTLIESCPGTTPGDDIRDIGSPVYAIEIGERDPASSIERVKHVIAGDETVSMMDSIQETGSCGSSSHRTAFGKTKHLDGDIWVLVKWKGKEEIISRFCDLSDESDVLEQVRAIREVIEKKKKDGELEVLGQFDEIHQRFGYDRLAPGEQESTLDREDVV